MQSFLTMFSSIFTRGDQSIGESMAPRDPLPTLPSASGPSLSSSWRSEGYSNAATLLHSGSVDAFVTQQALYPSAWWLR